MIIFFPLLCRFFPAQMSCTTQSSLRQ